MQAIEIYRRTWGGDESLIKQLEDLEPEFPFWARPLWRALCRWLKPLIRKKHQRRTMREVDRQAQQIGDQWQSRNRETAALTAARAAQQEHPEAKVSIHRTPHMPCDAVMIEHPPDPANPAQMAMGFGWIELRSPYGQ